jgi:hypothetical protein
MNGVLLMLLLGFKCHTGSAGIPAPSTVDVSRGMATGILLKNPSFE